MGEEDPIREHLGKFKDSEEDYMHTGVLLAGDKDAQVVLSTWTTMPLDRVKPLKKPPAEERELWDWMWTTVRINWAQFSERTGMNTARVQKIFEPLRANRLVYPDGSVANHALGVLTSEVLKALKGSNQSK